jgi:hypothetical protein
LQSYLVSHRCQQQIFFECFLICLIIIHFVEEMDMPTPNLIEAYSKLSSIEKFREMFKNLEKEISLDLVTDNEKTHAYIKLIDTLVSAIRWGSQFAMDELERLNTEARSFYLGKEQDDDLFSAPPNHWNIFQLVVLKCLGEYDRILEFYKARLGGMWRLNRYRFAIDDDTDYSKKEHKSIISELLCDGLHLSEILMPPDEEILAFREAYLWLFIKHDHTDCFFTLPQIRGIRLFERLIENSCEEIRAASFYQLGRFYAMNPNATQPYISLQLAILHNFRYFQYPCRANESLIGKLKIEKFNEINEGVWPDLHAYCDAFYKFVEDNYDVALAEARVINARGRDEQNALMCMKRACAAGSKEAAAWLKEFMGVLQEEQREIQTVVALVTQKIEVVPILPAVVKLSKESKKQFEEGIALSKKASFVKALEQLNLAMEGNHPLAPWVIMYIFSPDYHVYFNLEAPYVLDNTVVKFSDFVHNVRLEAEARIKRDKHPENKKNADQLVSDFSKEAFQSLHKPVLISPPKVEIVKPKPRVQQHIDPYAHRILLNGIAFSKKGIFIPAFDDLIMAMDSNHPFAPWIILEVFTSLQYVEYIRSNDKLFDKCDKTGEMANFSYFVEKAISRADKVKDQRYKNQSLALIKDVAEENVKEKKVEVKRQLTLFSKKPAAKADILKKPNTTPQDKKFQAKKAQKQTQEFEALLKGYQKALQKKEAGAAAKVYKLIESTEFVLAVANNQLNEAAKLLLEQLKPEMYFQLAISADANEEKSDVGSVSTSEGFYQRAAALGHAEAAFEMGRILEQRGQSQQALGYYAQSLVINDNLRVIMAFNKLANYPHDRIIPALMKLHQAEKAIKERMDVAEARPCLQRHKELQGQLLLCKHQDQFLSKKINYLPDLIKKIDDFAAELPFSRSTLVVR